MRYYISGVSLFLPKLALSFLDFMKQKFTFEKRLLLYNPKGFFVRSCHHKSFTLIPLHDPVDSFTFEITILHFDAAKVNKYSN